MSTFIIAIFYLAMALAALVMEFAFNIPGISSRSMQCADR